MTPPGHRTIPLSTPGPHVAWGPSRAGCDGVRGVGSSGPLSCGPPRFGGRQGWGRGFLQSSPQMAMADSRPLCGPGLGTHRSTLSSSLCQELDPGKGFHTVTARVATNMLPRQTPLGAVDLARVISKTLLFQSPLRAVYEKGLKSEKLKNKRRNSSGMEKLKAFLIPDIDLGSEPQSPHL